MAFRPKIGEEIHLNAQRYWFTGHPSAKGMPYGQTGRRATVYQLRDPANQLHALKVFTLAFRSPQTEAQAAQIARFTAIQGLEACRRAVLTPQANASLIEQQPDLKYAVLMPWVQGVNWQEVILTRRPVAAEVSHRIAGELIDLLANMERQGIAHCDLSGPNVLLHVNGHDGAVPVSLIDLEDLYAPGLSAPVKPPAGSVGYAHPEVRAGVWRPEADRFAGAVLIAEMLAWCDERARRIACSEQYFDPNEMQTGSERYQVLVQVLRERWGDSLASVFTRAWFAESLNECPSFADWQRAFDPPPDPGALFSQLQRSDRLGRWAEAQQLSAEILKIDHDRLDVLPIRARAQRLQQMDAEIQAVWQAASQSGLTADWEACLQQVNTASLLAPQVVLYQAQRAQAEDELETALRVDEIEEQMQSGNWELARRSLAGISPMQPRFLILKRKIEQYDQQMAGLEKIRRQAQDAYQNGDWQQTLAVLQAIQQVQPLDPEMAKLAQSARTVIARDQELQSALARIGVYKRAGDFAAAIRQADDFLAGWPDHAAVLRLKEELAVAQTRSIAHQSALAAVRKQIADDHLQEALEALAALPSNLAEVAQLQTAIAQRLKWRQKLQDAANAWQMSEVLRSLDQRPPEEPDQPDLRRLAADVLRLDQELAKARAANNPLHELQLLEQAPEGYPGRRQRLERLKWDAQIHEKLIAGLRNYDFIAVNEIYLQMDLQDIRRPDLYHWLKVEKDRAHQVENIRLESNLEEARRLLAELPDDHPLRRELTGWISQETTLRERIMDSLQRYDLQTCADLLESMTRFHPLERTLRQRLEEERKRADRIRRARSLYDGHAMLLELAAIEEDYPDYANLKAWAEQELERQERVKRAMLSGRMKEIEQCLSALPSDHPFAAELRDWLDHSR